jgi:hypothetical protein
MLLTHFIWQTDLKPLSGTNAKNGAITPSLTPTMHIIHARCYKASEWVGGSLQCRRGILVILWMSLVDVVVETYDGPAWRLISTLCGESATRNLANHSMRIQDVYVGTVPIPRFIKE